DPALMLHIIFIEVKVDVASELTTEIRPTRITPILKREYLGPVFVMVFSKPGIAKIPIPIMAKLHLVGFPVVIVVDIDDHPIDQSCAFQADYVRRIGLIGRNVGSAPAIVNDLEN